MKGKKQSGRKRNKGKSQPIYSTAKKTKNKICSVLETATRYPDFKQLNTYTGSYDSEQHTTVFKRLEQNRRLPSIIY